jgi:hypothetical protein
MAILMTSSTLSGLEFGISNGTFAIRDRVSELKEIMKGSSFSPDFFWPVRYFSTDQRASDRNS